MPSYKTLVQILIAISVASSTLAAPVPFSPEEEKAGFGFTTPTSEKPSTTVDPPTEHAPVPATDHPAPARVMSPFAWKFALLTALGGSALGAVSTSLLEKHNNSHSRTLQRSVEGGGPILLSPASLSDEHLLFNS